MSGEIRSITDIDYRISSRRDNLAYDVNSDNFLGFDTGVQILMKLFSSIVLEYLYWYLVSLSIDFLCRLL